MTERFKLAYIGAGSFRFSIGFFRNIVNAKELLPIEVALCDIDENSLDIMHKILTRMVEKASRKKHYGADDIIVTKSVDRRNALENASFVYKSISVGMQESEWTDNYLPLKFGIPSNTGDTLGPGGLFRSFRTDHIAAGIAKDMAELCPKAPLLNYTNPQGSITMAARTAAPGVQYIGLCHELFGGGAILWAFLVGKGRAPRPFKDVINHLEYAGINHLGWITKFEYKGMDYYPALRAKAKALGKSKRFLMLRWLEYGFNFHLLNRYCWFPYPGSRHVAEFLTDYYNYFNYEIQSPFWRFPVVRNVSAVDKERRTHYAKFERMASGEKGVPGPRTIGERAMEMTLDWKNGHPENRPHVVNIPNVHPDYTKIVPELPDDCIVEIPGYFKDGKILPVKTIHLPEKVAALVRPHAEQQRYTVDAALGNDLDLCVKAMLHDPMANWIEDDDKLAYLTRLMLFYQKRWLPAEWAEWIPSEDELKRSKWWVSPKDLAKEGYECRKVMFPPDDRLKSKAFFWPES
jgi:alpha-galactosidase